MFISRDVTCPSGSRGSGICRAGDWTVEGPAHLFSNFLGISGYGAPSRLGKRAVLLQPTRWPTDLIQECIRAGTASQRRRPKVLRWCTTEARKCVPPGAVRLRRSPTVWAYFEWAQRRDPQRAKIPLVATAHYLMRVTWVMLRRGTVWEGKLALAKEPIAA
jgi:hypothetical protein